MSEFQKAERLVAAFKEGQCPSCLHPQHIGGYCEEIVSKDVDMDADGVVHTVPVYCRCPPHLAIKANKGKQKGFRLFAWDALAEIVGVYEYGIRKGYLADSWRQVPVEDYEDALVRHAIDYLSSRDRDCRDHESGLRVIAHLVWNGIAVLVLSRKK